MTDKALCTVIDCSNPCLARSLCQYHYHRARRNGGVVPPDPTPLPREVPPAEPGLVTHTPAGTVILHGGAGTAYAAYGCRCRVCTEANRARAEKGSTERRIRMTAGDIPETVRHGTRNAYANWACRCDECKAAGSKSNESYYRRVLSADARRLKNADSWDKGFEAKSRGRKKTENPHRGK